MGGSNDCRAGMTPSCNCVGRANPRSRSAGARRFYILPVNFKVGKLWILQSIWRLLEKKNGGILIPFFFLITLAAGMC